MGFIRFELSPEGQKIVEEGIFPIPKEYIDFNKKKLRCLVVLPAEKEAMKRVKDLKENLIHGLFFFLSVTQLFFTISVRREHKKGLYNILRVNKLHNKYYIPNN